MTIREELEKLGPERVRSAMVAFGHRDESGDRMPECNHGICCFLSHASVNGGWIWKDRIELTGDETKRPAVEAAFEQMAGTIGRDAFRQECIAFLAEHGSAVENRPVHTISR